MTIKLLITKAREAFNRADNAAARKFIKEINYMLNGRANK